jgi:peptide deformylase
MCLSCADACAAETMDMVQCIRARWQDEQGQAHEQEIDGLLAVCLQHEMDHLNGVLFNDHLSRLKRDMILRKLAKQRKELKAA